MTILARYTKQLSHYLRNTKAVSALEYAILVGIIVVGIGAALVLLNKEITKAITKATTEITEQTGKIGTT